MISALIGVLIIVVIGAICFWAIDKFSVDRRLSQLLKLLVVLICLAAILQRVLPLLGISILSLSPCPRADFRERRWCVLGRRLFRPPTGHRGKRILRRSRRGQAIAKPLTAAFARLVFQFPDFSRRWHLARGAGHFERLR